jgi:hypothetical protein
MTNEPGKPVLGRPPLDGTDDELNAWSESFVNAVLGEPPVEAEDDGGPVLSMNSGDGDEPEADPEWEGVTSEYDPHYDQGPSPETSR